MEAVHDIPKKGTHTLEYSLPTELERWIETNILNTQKIENFYEPLFWHPLMCVAEEMR